MLVMLPGTVTSWPRPIDRTMSCAGLITDWAVAGPAGAAASGASAHAAISAVFLRRLFIFLPLVFVSQASVWRVNVRAILIGLPQRGEAERRHSAGRADTLGLAVEQRTGAAVDGLDRAGLAARDGDGRPGRGRDGTGDGADDLRRGLLLGLGHRAALEARDVAAGDERRGAVLRTSERPAQQLLFVFLRSIVGQVHRTRRDGALEVGLVVGYRAQHEAERADRLGDGDLLGDPRRHFERDGAELADDGIAVLGCLGLCRTVHC